MKEIFERKSKKNNFNTTLIQQCLDDYLSLYKKKINFCVRCCYRITLIRFGCVKIKRKKRLLIRVCVQSRSWGLCQEIIRMVKLMVETSLGTYSEARFKKTFVGQRKTFEFIFRQIRADSSKK